MKYQEWVQLFGRTAFDPELKAKLAAAGKGEVPVLGPEDLYAMVELDDMILSFTTEALFPDLKEEVGEGTGVLTGVTLNLRMPGVPTYSGPLPGGIDPDDSQAEVRRKLGPPDEANDRRKWDQWDRDNIQLNVSYSRDLSQIVSLMIRLPEP